MTNKLMDDSFDPSVVGTLTAKRDTPIVMAIYDVSSPIFFSSMMAAGAFVMITPVTQFLVFSFFNGWSLTNFTWWSL